MGAPTPTDSELYHVLFANDRARAHEYSDHPGGRTSPHGHPDSVMVTLSSFRRRLWSGGREVEVALPVHQARWLDAQEHSGMNIGESQTHAIFVELKGQASASPNPSLGPR